LFFASWEPRRRCLLVAGTGHDRLGSHLPKETAMFTKAFAGAALVLVAVGLAMGRADIPKNKDEFRVINSSELEGKWTITSMVYNGIKNEMVQDWTFRGDRVVTTSQGNEL